MRKRVALAIVLPTILLSAFLVVFFLNSPGGLEPKTIYVDASNAGDPAEDGSAEHPFNMIQEGVDSASPGYTVQVAPGTYFENVVIDKSSISIVAEENTIVDHGGTGIIMNVTGQDVTISGFTIQNGYHGIWVVGSNNTLSGNNIVDNSITGILVSGERNILRDNRMEGNMYNFGVSGEISQYSTHTIDPSNLVNGRPVCYWVNRNNEQVPTDVGYVAAINSANITVRNVNLSNNWQGTLFVNSTHSLIENVTISQCRISLDLTRCAVNTLRDNTLSHNSLAISINESNNNTLRRNNMSNNRYNFAVEGSQLSHFIQDIDTSNTIDGKPLHYLTNQRNLSIDFSNFKSIGYLGLVNSTNVNMRGLTLENNGQGILFAQTTNSTIKDVNILNNVEGISLWNSSDNTIESNTISNNNEALRFVDSGGNEIRGNTLSQNYLGITINNSSDNIFHKNNFINNTIQVETDRSMNMWDYGAKGNHWGDYNGTDQDGDNIGDIPYLINENNQDNYPLMTPWKTIQGDLNGDGVVDELDLLIWENAVGSYPGNPRWNPVADLNGDGCIDIYDAALILVNLGKDV